LIGRVSLIGAGPGDPELLTLRGAQRLREADVVFYDSLVHPAILVHCRPEARRVAVGKRRGAETISQDRIQAALIREAWSGRRVVRLKGGDPFVFGRGAEEAMALVEHGVPFEIVPGICSGIAAPALAGIPLTHRGMAGSAGFITAHDLAPGPTGDALRRNLVRLARAVDTLVVFMAGAQAARLRRALLDAGLDGATPVARIESGTLPTERLTTGRLSETGWLESDVVDGPVIFVLGKTVTLSRALRGGDGAGPRRAGPSVETLPAYAHARIAAEGRAG
jgi:uroporphyrin-III C-methyltransferase